MSSFVASLGNIHTCSMTPSCRDSSVISSGRQWLTPSPSILLSCIGHQNTAIVSSFQNALKENGPKIRARRPTLTRPVVATARHFGHFNSLIDNTHNLFNLFGTSSSRVPSTVDMFLYSSQSYGFFTSLLHELSLEFKQLGVIGGICPLCPAIVKGVLEHIYSWAAVGWILAMSGSGRGTKPSARLECALLGL